MHRCISVCFRPFSSACDKSHISAGYIYLGTACQSSLFAASIYQPCISAGYMYIGAARQIPIRISAENLQNGYKIAVIYIVIRSETSGKPYACIILSLPICPAAIYSGIYQKISISLRVINTVASKFAIPSKPGYFLLRITHTIIIQIHIQLRIPCIL